MYGKNVWLIADGFMSDTTKGDLVSHEAVCVLNLSGKDANINITLYFENDEPMRGIHAVCKHERTNHIRLDKIITDDKIPIPSDFEKELKGSKTELTIVKCANDK